MGPFWGTARQGSARAGAARTRRRQNPAAGRKEDSGERRLINPARPIPLPGAGLRSVRHTIPAQSRSMGILPPILTARVLAGCSLEAATPAAPAPIAAKAPQFQPALIREDVAGIQARCESGAAGGVSAAEVVRKGKSPSGAIEEFDLQRIHPSAETKRSCGAGGCENPAFRVSAYGTAAPPSSAR